MKFHRGFQYIAIPFMTAYDHIKYSYHVIGRENIPEGGSCAPTTRSGRIR